jgi:hypothetical protein
MTAVLSLAERFWKKVDRSGGPEACWPWLGALNKYGYGHFRGEENRTLRANRVAVALGDPPDVVRLVPIEPRDIPDCMYALHSCDVRLCCNPAHLRIGNSSENLKDQYARWRRPANALSLRKADRRKDDRGSADRRTA